MHAPNEEISILSDHLSWNHRRRTLACQRKLLCIMKMLRILNQQRQRKISISFVWRIIFKREWKKRVHWLPLKLSLLSTFNGRMKTTHNTEKFAIHEIRCLFSSFCQRNSISIIGEKKSERKNTHNIWIKSFHDGAPRVENLHTEGPLLNHNCAFQLHHVTKLLNDSSYLPKKNKIRCLNGKKNCRFSLTCRKSFIA